MDVGSNKVPNETRSNEINILFSETLKNVNTHNKCGKELNLTVTNKRDKLCLFHQNIRGLNSSKIEELSIQWTALLPHILCITEHHLKDSELNKLHIDHYTLGASYCRQSRTHGGEEDIKQISARLEEGGTVEYEVELLYSHGENLKEFFDTDIDGPVVTLIPNESFNSTEFSGNFGVLILQAKQQDTKQIGRTVIHVTLPGNYVTPQPTSTTETTVLPSSCPTEETTYTADTTVQSCTCPSTTYCPTAESTITSPTTSGYTSDPDEGSTATTNTTTIGNTETCEPCDCSCGTPESSTAPPESSVCTTGYTSDPDEGSTATTNTTTTTTTIGNTETCEPCNCSYGTPESSTAPPESCVCTTGYTSDPDEGSTATTSTTIGNTETCEPCNCSCGTPESSTAPPQEESIYFADPQAIVYIYEQQMGYIKTMSAFCTSVCKIEYKIVDGPLSSSLYIDHDNGDINITQNIMESGLFNVMATAEIDGKIYNETATVHLNVMTLQLCQNGSQWTNTLTVKSVQEELKTSYIVEKCDLIPGCECAIVNVIPEGARDYFTAGGRIELNKKIDREDTELFPDQSNTYIILHLELRCEDNVKTTYKFWDRRSQSAIDNIGTIKYDASRTVIVLRIEDINDNQPKFELTSPLTVGYPNAEIAGQLLPPYLMKIQATDIDFGENATIKYRLTPDDQFFIHQDTGVIYPVAGAFKYEDTQFTVYASDSVHDGEPLEVNVVTLSPDNLLVIRQAGSVLEDVNAVINKITNLAHCNIKLLSSAVIASDTVRNDAVNKKVDDRQLPNFKSMKESKNSLLQLVVYGLDNQTKPVSYSDIKKGLEGVADFTLESWTDRSNSSASTDTGLLIAVIVLAVIILLLLGSAGVAYLLYIRSRRDKNDYYDKILNDSGRSSVSQVDEKAVSPVIEEEYSYAIVLPSSNMEVIQPSAPPSPQLSTTKPAQELVASIEPDEFNQETTDLKNTENNGDGGENEDGSNFENVATRRKSVVTFNDNVERIDIDEV